MSIIRSPRPDANYTIVENSLINSDLDWRELGLLIYLLSKPDNWEISITHLARQKKTGSSGIKSAIKKLKEAGYVKMQRESSGYVNWFVYDNPQVENPQVEKPHEANQPLISTDLITNTDIKQKEKEKEKTAIDDKFKPENYRVKNLNIKAWTDYCDYRRKILKKPIKTERGAKTQAKLLISNDFRTQQEIIDQTINNEWTGLFPVKKYKTTSGDILRWNQEIFQNGLENFEV